MRGAQAAVPPGRLPQTPRLRAGHTPSFGNAVQEKGLCCVVGAAELLSTECAEVGSWHRGGGKAEPL